MSNTLPDEIQRQLNNEISKEISRNVRTQVAPELIPFHALPIYKESKHIYSQCIMIMWLIIYKYKINFI